MSDGALNRPDRVAAQDQAQKLATCSAGPLSLMMCITPVKAPNMPTYHIEMFEGRTAEQKKKLVEEITRVTVEVLGGSPESVDIIISDVKRENWATGGKLWSEPLS